MSHHPADPAARKTYEGAGLAHLDTAGPAQAPLPVLQQWWEDAVEDPRVFEPAAMGLATVDSTGLPNVRTVLMKDLDAEGVTFYTNLHSAKATELESGHAAAVFSWHAMYRQVRLRGSVEPVSRQEAQRYWDSRPRGSQLASAASHQSTPLASRAALEQAVARLTATFEGQAVPLPQTWGGYRLRPVEIECWVGLPSRLHDRVRWSCQTPMPLEHGTGWHWSRLQP